VTDSFEVDNERWDSIKGGEFD